MMKRKSRNTMSLSFQRILCCLIFWNSISVCQSFSLQRTWLVKNQSSFVVIPKRQKHYSSCHYPFQQCQSWIVCRSTNSDDVETPVYDGPILDNDDTIIAGLSLSQLGIDLVIAPSTVAPGQLGLYISLSPDVDSVTLPAFTLLCGYSRNGTFEAKDEGDRTVGFAFTGSIDSGAVFYNQQLMSIKDALEMAASDVSKEFGEVELKGHILVQQEEEEDKNNIQLYPCDYEDETTPFGRYFVPDLVNGGMISENEEEEESSWRNELTVQNFGQFCNDLAWSYTDPPSTQEEYNSRSIHKNAVQLIWRLEYDSKDNTLIPSWPVSVTSQDWTFTNKDTFMELGTKYGWNYWQATVDMETIK